MRVTLHRPLVKKIKKKKITSTLGRLTRANNAQGKISRHDACACWRQCVDRARRTLCVRRSRNVGVHLWMDIVWNMEGRDRVTGEIGEKSADSHEIALFLSRVFV